MATVGEVDAERLADILDDTLEEVKLETLGYTLLL